MVNHDAKKPVTAAIDVERTKVILSKMFDIEEVYDFNNKLLIAFSLHNYFELLREKSYTKSKLFMNCDDAERDIKNWLDLKDKRLPGTYEKYLLLSRLFNCSVNDIICLENNSEKALSADFRIMLNNSFDYSDNILECSIYLPKIRSKMKNKDGFWYERFSCFMDDDIGLHEKMGTKDGITIEQKVIDYYASQGVEKDEATKISNYFKKNVVDVWKKGRYLIGIEMLMTFCKATGIRYSELYKETNELIEFSLSNEMDKKISRKEKFIASAEIKKIIEQYLSKNSLIEHKVCKDYLITKKADENKYGLIAIVDGVMSYLPAQYDYVVKGADKIYAIANGRAIEVKPQSFERTLAAEQSSAVFSQKVLHCLKAIALTAIKIVCHENVFCFKTDEGVVVHSGNSSILARRERDDAMCGDMLIVNIKGIEYFGFLGEDNFIIPPIYEAPLKVSEKFYLIKKNGKYGFLNEKGNLAVDSVYEDASVFSEGMAVIKIGGKYGFIDKSGKITIEPAYENACDFKEGLACVRLDKKDGYINKHGKIVIEPQFENGYRFSEGVAVVEVNGKYGYIDKNGKSKLRTIYEGAMMCKDGIVRVISGGKLIQKRI